MAMTQYKPSDEGRAPTAETKTTIDSLLDLIKKKGRIDLNRASAELNTSPNVIEGWAKVLEEGKLIKISYEVGRMFMELPEGRTASEQLMKQKAEVEMNNARNLLTTQTIKLGNLSDSLSKLKVQFSAVDELYRKALPDVHKRLAEINSIYDGVEKHARDIEASYKSITSDYEKSVSEIDAMDRKIQAFLNKSAESGNELKLPEASEFKSRIDSLEKQIDEMRRNKDNMVQAIRKSVESQLRELESSIEQDSKSLTEKLLIERKNLDEVERSARDQLHTAKGFSDMYKNFRNELEKDRGSIVKKRDMFADSYNKFRKEADNANRLIHDKLKEVDATMKAVKEGYGVVGAFDEQMHSVSLNLSTSAEIIKELESITERLIGDVNAVLDSKGMDADDELTLANEIRDKAADSDKKISEVESSISKAASGLKNAGEMLEDNDALQKKDVSGGAALSQVQDQDQQQPKGKGKPDATVNKGQKKK
ncbi:MAG: hypothetical protein M1500_03590 [Candidatus Marsarchaeota archaeon]|nr:hypothetical protein [Candidatus Marsarchaeota archaeon]